MLQSVLSKTVEQSVACPNCGRGMWLYCVQSTDAPGHEQRVFSCSECAQQKTVLVKQE